MTNIETPQEEAERRRQETAYEEEKEKIQSPKDEANFYKE